MQIQMVTFAKNIYKVLYKEMYLLESFEAVWWQQEDEGPQCKEEVVEFQSNCGSAIRLA